MNGLGESAREVIRGVLDGLDHDVSLLLELGPAAEPVTVLAGAREIDFAAETTSLLEEIAVLSDRIDLTVTETSTPGAWPKTTVDGRLVYHGFPWGYELATLVGAIGEAGRAVSSLAPETLSALDDLENDVALEVFVTPT